MLIIIIELARVARDPTASVIVIINRAYSITSIKQCNAILRPQTKHNITQRAVSSA